MQAWVGQNNLLSFSQLQGPQPKRARRRRQLQRARAAVNALFVQNRGPASIMVEGQFLTNRDRNKMIFPSRLAKVILRIHQDVASEGLLNLSKLSIRYAVAGVIAATLAVSLAPGAQSRRHQANQGTLRRTSSASWKARTGQTPTDYRNAAGAPGYRYWQQKVDYDVAVRLDEDSKLLTGREDHHLSQQFARQPALSVAAAGPGIQARLDQQADRNRLGRQHQPGPGAPHPALSRNGKAASPSSR